MAIAARAVLYVAVLTLVAPFDNTAQRGRAAGLDGPHQRFLMPGQIVRQPVGWAVLSKDVGQFKRWPWHSRSAA